MTKALYKTIDVICRSISCSFFTFSPFWNFFTCFFIQATLMMNKNDDGIGGPEGGLCSSEIVENPNLKFGFEKNYLYYYPSGSPRSPYCFSIEFLTNLEDSIGPPQSTTLFPIASEDSLDLEPHPNQRKTICPQVEASYSCVHKLHFHDSREGLHTHSPVPLTREACARSLEHIT